MSLYAEIASEARLLEGWERTHNNSDMAGVDHVTGRMFELRLERELAALRYELQTRTYQALPLLQFDIPKPNGKMRTLRVPTIRDRVVQSAALAVLQPLVEHELEHSSFAYRPGRSYQDAIERLRVLREAGYVWVVDADITSFFDEVDHDVLMQRFAEVVPEADVEALVRQWITADAMVDGRRIQRTEGLPQGAVISPMLANLYLDRFDEALEKAGYKLVRYADDFVILCRSRPKAEKALELTEDLLGTLELRINAEKTRITSFEEGFRFLGSLFVRSLILPSKNRSLEAAPRRPEANKEAAPAATSPDALSVPESPESEATAGDTPPFVAPAPTVPNPKQLEETALGRAFLRALDAEGISLQAFVGAMTSPAPAAEALPAALALSEDDLPDPTAPVVLKPGAVPFLRTLYIQEQGAWLRINQKRFVVTVGTSPGKELLTVPAVKIDQVMIFGNCLITPAALRFCLRNSIRILLLSSRGTYYGALEPSSGRNVARQRVQFLRTVDADFRLATARLLIEAKLHNTHRVLRRYAQRRGDAELVQATRALARLLRVLPNATTLDELRGYEGHGAAVYFGVFGKLLEGSAFAFEGRNRRPPLDPVNAMLSLGYTLLFNNLYAFVRVHQLHPYAGFLHDERTGHPALVSDLVEEFRFVIDRLVLALCNRGHVKPDQFTYADATQGCFLTDESRKTFFRAFEQVMHREVKHPVTGHTLTYRRCLDVQVRTFVRYLENGEPYVPFKMA